MIRKNYVRPVAKNNKLSYGVLKIYPKSNFRTYRTLATNQNSRNPAERLSTRRISFVLWNKCANLFTKKDLYAQWLNFLKAAKDRDIYGAKVDLKDAFGNVDIGETFDYLLSN